MLIDFTLPDVMLKNLAFCRARRGKTMVINTTGLNAERSSCTVGGGQAPFPSCLPPTSVWA